MVSDTSFDVVICGGGPVGMGLAIELGQRGVRALVIERHHQPQPVPKGQNLTQRTMEHFRCWGIEQALRDARTVPAGQGIGGITAYGSLSGPHWYDWLQRDLVRPYYAAANERLPQYATEAVLRARVAELASVEVRYGLSVESVTQDAEGVTVTARSRDEGAAPLTVRGRYAVGCDGSRSVARQAAGITQTLSDHDRMMALLVFRSTALPRIVERFPGKAFYNVLRPELDGYWLFFGRVDGADRWFFHAPVPRSAAEGGFDFQAYLETAIGAPIDLEIDYVGYWDLRFAIADRYRQGRVFVAGDAAHSHPPYGGYGINTGFEDARNLGWKLAALLHGWGGDELADSYHVERHGVFASTARDFIAKAIDEDRAFLRTHDPAHDAEGFAAAWHARSIGARDEVGAFEPHYEGSPIVPGTHGPGGSALGRHRFEAVAGHHLAPAPLPGGGDLFDRLSDGFTLIDLGDGAGAAQFGRAAETLGIPLACVHEPSTALAERYGAPLLLIRPDHFVAWTGHASDEAAATLATASGQAPDPR